MSVLDFLSSLVWPIVVLVIIFIFRSPLKELIARIKSIKYKGIEIEIGDKLELFSPEGTYEIPIQPPKPVEKEREPAIQKLSESDIEESRLHALKRLQEDTERNGVQRGELFQTENGKWAIAWKAVSTVKLGVKVS